ncbi:TIGR03986 family CRISPR-associated RAMP protein [Armatimonas sp.]|uniref:TIGR03986 family type III CRISPR-associated RAMP protein n=1 Tax=Armatimonas sp. TaxID=1872638 RepID=UPI00374D439A
MPSAITPYNFIPLPRAILHSETPVNFDQSHWHADRHTGWVEVEYEALTPIFTRAEKDTTEFFHHGDQTPILPGSSLRGMVRAAFEIFTYSRMEFVADRRYYYRYFASNKAELREQYINQFKPDTNLVAGQLVETNFGLVLRVSNRFTKGFAAIDDRKINRPGSRCQAIKDWFATTGGTVGLLRKPGAPQNPVTRWFHVPEVEIAYQEDTGAFEGWLMIPGRDVQHHHHFQVIAAPESTTGYTDYPIPDDVYEDYLAWGQMAHGSRFGTPNTPRKLVGGSPAFAVLSAPATSPNPVATLGANMMLALRYATSVHTMRDEQSEDSDSKMPDMAQSVFGSVSSSSNEGSSIRGRVFFEDAFWQRPEEKDATPWLDGQGGVRNVLLAGPKPTAIQTYLIQRDGENLRHWDSQDACLRGHKRYWHRSTQAALGELQPGPKPAGNTQRTDIRPVKPQTKFLGRIRFENLTDLELGALLYTIKLWPDAAHKFGMGKNLGLGSLKATLRGVTFLDPTKRYGSFSGNGQRPGSEAKGIFQRGLDLGYALAQREPGRFASMTALFHLPPAEEAERKRWDEQTRQVEIKNRDNQDSNRAHNSDQWKERYRLLPAVQVHRSQ